MRKNSYILGLLVAFSSFATGQVLPDQAQQEAWQNFNQKHGSKVFIRWHDETGTPATIHGFKSKPYSALRNPEEIARQFLKDNRVIFKMKKDLSDLNLLRDFEDNGVHHLDFKQTYRNIPVYGAEYSVAVGKDKTVHMGGGRYYAVIATPNDVVFSKEEAIEQALAFFNMQRLELRELISEFVLVPGESPFFAYRLGLDQWEAVVDASTGKVEIYFERMARINGTGNVYPKDPVNSSLTIVTIPRLWGAGYKLEGTYVDATNAELGDAYNSSRNFQYTPPNYTQHDGTHFDDTNVYYHIDKFSTEYWPVVGFPGLGVQVLASVHDPFPYGHDNAAANWITMKLYFGHGESLFWDWSKKNDMIYHEFTHLVSGKIGLGNDVEESRAMHEGYSDYHAASFTNDIQIGEWLTRNHPDLRRVDMNKTEYNYDNYYSLQQYSENPAESAHNKSMIWSGALWDLQLALGSGVADFLVYKGLVYKHASGTTFLDGREGVIIADDEYYNSANLNTIMNVFAARGIGDPSPNQPPTTPTGLDMTNQGFILENPQLVWNASTGATSYDIYRCEEYFNPCTYQVIGSTSSTSFKDVDVTITSQEMATGKYYYRVKAVNSYGVSGFSNTVATWGESFFKMRDEITDINEPVPDAFALESNYPNPFNPSTMIKYSLPEASSVSLVVYDLRGNEVTRWVMDNETAGYKRKTWNATDKHGNKVPAGVYLLKMTAESKVTNRVFSQTLKMVLIK